VKNLWKEISVDDLKEFAGSMQRKIESCIYLKRRMNR
jgi:hypothetical protein